MIFDATPQQLTGAFIRRAWRDGFWLCLDTDKGRVDVAGKYVRKEPIECPRCLEFRLVEAVEDARGVQGFCSVCSYAWWIVSQKESGA